MKTKFVTLFLTAASVIFAAEPMPTTKELPLQVKRSPVAIEHSNWFSYLRLSASDARPNEMGRVTPGVGLGFRFGLPIGALDVSASYNGTDVQAKGRYFYNAPRVAYFLYSSPQKDQSFYAGPGVAFGGMKTLDATTFTGIIPSLSVGYEMNRHQNWRSFLQVDVSQPAFTTAKKKPFMEVASAKLGPIAEASIGFGF
jgi:hypothetical protein